MGRLGKPGPPDKIAEGPEKPRPTPAPQKVEEKSLLHHERQPSPIDSEPNQLERVKNRWYVALNFNQREKLGVDPGDAVECWDGNVCLGVFIVGIGLKGNTDTQIGIAESHVVHMRPRTPSGEIDESQPPRKLTIKKCVTSPDKERLYEVKIGVEKADHEAAQKEAARELKGENDKRKKSITEKIKGRYRDADPEEYLKIPTALAAELGLRKGDEPTIRGITRIIVKRDGAEIPMIVVPSGDCLAFTTKAAAKLRIPAEGLKNLAVRVDNGKLVI